MITITNKFWVGGRLKKYGVDPSWLSWSNPSWKGGPQKRSWFSWPVFVTFLTQLLLTSLPHNLSLLRFLYFCLPIFTTWLSTRYPPTQYLLSYLWPYSPFVYWYPDVHPWASNINIYTTEPVGSPFYITIFLSQGLSQIYFSLLVPWDRVVFWTNGVTVPLLIPEAYFVFINI